MPSMILGLVMLALYLKAFPATSLHIHNLFLPIMKAERYSLVDNSWFYFDLGVALGWVL